MLPTK